LHTTVFLLILS